MQFYKFQTFLNGVRNVFGRTPRIQGGPGFSGRRPKWPWDINTQSDQYPNLTVWYPMADPSNPATLVDLISPSRNNAPISAGTQAVQSDQLFNSVESFSGTQAFATTQTGSASDANLTNSTPFSLTGWVNLAVTTRVIAQKHNFGTGDGWQLSSLSFGAGLSLIVSDLAGHHISVAGAILSLSQWYQFAFTWDGTTPRSYVNGVDTSISPSVSGVTVPNYAGTSIVIGSDQHGSSYQGLLTDFRVYEGRALTAAQAAELYDPATRWQLMRARGNG